MNTKTTKTTKTTTTPGIDMKQAGRTYALHVLNAVWVQGRTITPQEIITLEYFDKGEPDRGETQLDACIRLAGLPPFDWQAEDWTEKAARLAAHIEKHEAAAAQGHPRT